MYKRGITFGAYDVLHVGHLNLLRRAKERCHELLVCVSDDQYVCRIKGHAPLLPLALRMACVKVLPYVDEVYASSLLTGGSLFSYRSSCPM